MGLLAPQFSIKDLQRLFFSGYQERNKPHHCPANQKYQSELEKTALHPVIISSIRLRPQLSCCSRRVIHKCQLQLPGKQHCVGRLCHRGPLTRSPQMAKKSPLRRQVGSFQTVTPYKTLGYSRQRHTWFSWCREPLSTRSQAGGQHHCSACSKGSPCPDASPPIPLPPCPAAPLSPPLNPPILKPVQAPPTPDSSSKTLTVPSLQLRC